MILTALMAHPRKLIRQAVVAMLTNATAAAARVKGTRIEPNKNSQLPALSVYTLHEPVDQDASADTAPRELKRDLQLEVTGWVGHTDEYAVDDRMDDLAEQIEAVMDGDRFLHGTAGESILTDTVMQVLAEDGHSDPTIGIVTLTYLVTYRTSPAAPGGLADFLTVDAKQQLVGGLVDTVPAEDTFTVQETPP